MSKMPMDRLTESEVNELVEIEERLATLSVEARRAANRSGYTSHQIAARMGNASHSTLQRLLRGMAYSASLDTLARFAWACGYTLEVNFVPRTEAKDAKPPESVLFDPPTF